MTKGQYINNLEVPSKNVDVILDTDTYNEIDDQFAVAYLICSDQLNIKGICAAPFYNERSTGPKDGMEKSYTEINNILDLTNKHELKSRVFKGSDRYLSNEFEPVESPAADFICRTADEYSPENPLYIVAIGAITNVASAILKNPNIIENAVVVWLGGHAPGFKNPASEFNMVQDIAAARVVFGCGVPLVQLPCLGVVDKLATTEFELAHWIKGKNKLCDYLFKRTMEYFGGNSPVSKVIWDVSAIAWLMNDRSKFMLDRYVPSPVPEYDKCYAVDQNRHLIKQVYQIDRDAIFKDLFDKLVRYE